MLPLIALTLLFGVSLDFVPVNFTFVYQILRMNSEKFMILTVFAQLTYVNILHWIVEICCYGFLVNEGIGLILVIQTFYRS